MQNKMATNIMIDQIDSGVKSSFTGYVTGPDTDWVGLGFDKI